MNTKEKKPIFKKWWFWVVAIIVIGAIGAGMNGTKNQATETTKSTTDSQHQSSTSETKSKEKKDRLTLDDGWQLDTSDPYSTKVTGTVSNNSDQAINSYIQITFSALDAEGANVGDCLANANTVDAKGKWKFEALCLNPSNNVKTVRFKDITGA